MDNYFSFLQRRTDFFYEASPGANMGFPPDYAESMVFNFFKRYQAEHYKRVPSNTEELKKKWNEYNENQKKLAEIKKQEAEAAKLAPKVEEIKPDGDKNEVKKPDVKVAAADDSSK